MDHSLLADNNECLNVYLLISFEVIRKNDKVWTKSLGMSNEYSSLYPWESANYDFQQT